MTIINKLLIKSIAILLTNKLECGEQLHHTKTADMEDFVGLPPEKLPPEVEYFSFIFQQINETIGQNRDQLTQLGLDPNLIAQRLNA